MRNFFRHQRAGNHAGNMTLHRQHRIRDDGHQTDIAAAINQTVSALHQCPAEAARRLGIFRARAVPRTGKDADFALQIVHASPN